MYSEAANQARLRLGLQLEKSTLLFAHAYPKCKEREALVTYGKFRTFPRVVLPSITELLNPS